MNKAYTYTPEIVSAPGETLEEILDDRQLAKVELAQRTGLTQKTINQILKGKQALTPETALKLEHVIGIPASFWNNREQAYRDYLARAAEMKRLKDSLHWLREIPIRELIKRQLIPDGLSKPELLRAVLSFFGVDSVSDWQIVYAQPQVAYRKSRSYESQPGALATWLRIGEREAAEINTVPFNKRRFLDVLHEIRSLTVTDPEEFQPRMTELCASAGVAVVFVPEVKGSRTSGATQWISPNKALIQLSLRYKTNDHLWFTFFHEAAHILKHGKKLVFLESNANGVEGSEEEEANYWASDFLIPQGKYREFTDRFQQRYSKQEICDFAASIGIAPGIIVGRLQHDGKLPTSHCNGLKISFEWNNTN